MTLFYKRFITLITLKRPLTTMYPQMRDQISLICKTLLTLITDEWSGSCMRSIMDSQAILSRVLLTAPRVIADKRSLAIMFQHMRIQVSLRYKFCKAFWTLIRSLASLNLL